MRYTLTGIQSRSMKKIEYSCDSYQKLLDTAIKLKCLFWRITKIDNGEIITVKRGNLRFYQNMQFTEFQEG